ncbi:BMP family ABC transporter substrate-binding protein [Salinigranum rubrum]|uniref:BMP family ABC transporter substrate-binding protein n=1 Tax=Salinigranum rubrum TaxID=755307 RepID=A0A2I8VRU9_9EURY|nr:BMP family protein [Salinigranum rubrum]AUV83929.1 BMP family ABC transporter substrate-binding protein [Salinigranum rubrum]
MDRRTFIKGTSVAGLAGLAGCSGGPSGGSSGESSGGSESTATETSSGGDSGESTESDGMEETETEPGESGGSESINVGMVYATGGLGDGSFNDQAQQGAFQARDEFDVQIGEAQPEEVAQFSTFQQQFAQSTDPAYDLVCCIGFLQTDALSQTAQDYPDQNFMLVDSVVEADNVANYVFAEHEGSYLVGQMAGLLTTQDFSAGAGSTAGDSTTVGFVGGVESDLIRKFEAGYTAGVKAADENIEVLTNYTGSFNDPAAGKEAALAMYNSGADIVYHASGNTGTGVFQAAQEQGAFAIGVDRDQSVTKESFADVILASMVKRVDTAVYDAIESVVNDNFQGGNVVTLGLEENGVAAVYGSELESEIPQDVKDAVASSRESIIAGDISVPSDPSNV